jgi:hypothetical protein
MEDTMPKINSARLLPGLTFLALAACTVQPDMTGATRLDWSGARQIASVDPLYLSFNVEMVEVTGGRFWAPYDNPSKELYAYRPPLDMSNPRLRNLTRALAPAYMRVSGTWAAVNTEPKPAGGLESGVVPSSKYVELAQVPLTRI